jgi:hypothetical protein
MNDDQVPDHPFACDPIEVPDWFGRSWSVLEDDPGLDRSLAAYLEGAQLRLAGHPSAALVMLAACIESLSPELAAPPCPKCGEIKGSTDRFEQGLAAALTPEEMAMAQLDDTYRQRSRTAHSGALHGFEYNFGVWEHRRLMRPGDAFMFSMPQMHMVQRAAGVLLIRAIEKGASRRAAE